MIETRSTQAEIATSTDERAQAWPDGKVCVNKECRACTEDLQCDGGKCNAGK